MQGLEVVKKNVGKSENICIYNEGFSIEFSFYIRNVNIILVYLRVYDSYTHICTTQQDVYFKTKTIFYNGTTIKKYTPLTLLMHQNLFHS